VNGKPLRSNDIREQNEKLVLQIIYRHDGISQSQVANVTGLKPPSVFRIFSNLQERGVIEECPPPEGAAERMGRKPSYYRVTPGSFYAVGIDFWSAGAAIEIINFGGETAYQHAVSFAEGATARHVLGEIITLLQDALASLGEVTGQVLGIGVGAPGVVDIEHGYVMRYRRIPGIEEYNIKSELEERFELPVYMHNNSSVVALGEYRYGRDQHHGSVLSFLIRSGVGGAFLHNGQAYVNRGATAMEIGHMQIERGGRACECGGKGCLETYLSEEAMLAELKGTAGVNALSEAAERTAAGDKEVAEVLAGFGDLLGDAAMTLTNILNPGIFLVVTQYQAISQLFAERVRTRLRASDSSYITHPPDVIAKEYDPVRACRGAADLVYEAFFAVD
jgi:predicted NBD/HSP70 family sugar kinase